jgi:transcriptional regulator EpsA
MFPQTPAAKFRRSACDATGTNRTTQVKSIDAFDNSDEVERELFVRAAEVSVDIRRRYQFFLWSQGELQGLIPHGVLICGMRDGATQRLLTDSFSGAVMAEAQIDHLTREDGLFARTWALWQAGGGEPCHCSAASNGRLAELRAELEHLDMTDALFHGVYGPERQTVGFFGFLGIGKTIDRARAVQRLRLLAPYLHASFLRMLVFDGANSKAMQAAQLLSAREREILAYLHEGKSNAQIAQELTISPMTVKNHAQNIYKKLRVQNRVQAVAKGLTLKLVQPLATS